MNGKRSNVLQFPNKMNVMNIHYIITIYIYIYISLERTVTLLADPSSFEGEALEGKLLSNPKFEKGEHVGSQLKTSEPVRKL